MSRGVGCLCFERGSMFLVKDSMINIMNTIYEVKLIINNEKSNKTESIINKTKNNKESQNYQQNKEIK